MRFLKVRWLGVWGVGVLCIGVMIVAGCGMGARSRALTQLREAKTAGEEREAFNAIHHAGEYSVSFFDAQGNQISFNKLAKYSQVEHIVISWPDEGISIEWKLIDPENLLDLLLRD